MQNHIEHFSQMMIHFLHLYMIFFILKPLLIKVPSFWHDCVAFQRSSFGRQTAGNDVMTQWPLKVPFFSFFSFLFFFRRDLFSQKECSDQKTYLDKVDRSGPKPRVPDPVRHFVATWWPFWIFEVLTEETGVIFFHMRR